MNRGQRLAKRFRGFFSEMERGRILLLGTIVCVMLVDHLFYEIGAIIVWELYPDEFYHTFLHESTLMVLIYGGALVILAYLLVSVRGAMRDAGETITYEHHKELSVIGLGLALLALPMVLVSIIGLGNDMTMPEGYHLDSNISMRLVSYLGSFISFSLYIVIFIVSWRAYQSARFPVHIGNGAVSSFILIGFVMVSSNAILTFGYVKYHQIDTYGSGYGVVYYDLLFSPLWFYFYLLLTIAAIAGLAFFLNRMQVAREAMGSSQYQLLAVMAIGMLLIILPRYVDYMVYYIQYELPDMLDYDPDDYLAPHTIQSFYAFLSYVYTFLTYLLVGLMALRGFRCMGRAEAIPLDVVPISSGPD